VTAPIDEQPVETKPQAASSARATTSPWSVVLRVVLAIAIPVVGVVVMLWTFDFLRRGDANRLLIVAIAIAVGVGGVFFVFWAMDRVVDWLPERFREGVRPYVFVGPAIVILSVFLVYPVINTIIVSFKDAGARGFVGLDNYRFVFTDPSMLRSIRNTGMWIVVVPLASVSVGLIFATLADRLRHGEAVAKSLIFLPMAISFVGAAVTWRLIYSYRPEGYGSNIGLLNAVKVGVLGGKPVAWLSQQQWNANNLLLMVIMIWIQTGFAMVVLSSAIKAIPDEIIEAARIDGASELQVFRRIIIPSIMPTIVVVTTYMVINALKVFDIVFVMGNAEANHTEVIAERMIRWFFLQSHDGRGAAIAVVLFVAVIPVMVGNVRQFRQQEQTRRSSPHQSPRLTSSPRRRARNGRSSAPATADGSPASPSSSSCCCGSSRRRACSSRPSGPSTSSSPPAGGRRWPTRSGPGRGRCRTTGTRSTPAGSRTPS
jgi:alpha-glucoside transport system permease protein